MTEKILQRILNLSGKKRNVVPILHKIAVANWILMKAEGRIKKRKKS